MKGHPFLSRTYLSPAAPDAYHPHERVYLALIGVSVPNPKTSPANHLFHTYGDGHRTRLFYVGNVTYLLEERDLQHATGSHDGHPSTVVLE